jgi:hypothetical protein
LGSSGLMRFSRFDSWGQRAGSVFIVASAQECSSRECVVYSSFSAPESETNAHVVGSSRPRKDGMRAFSIIRNPIGGLGDGTQVEPCERRSTGMAYEMSNRGGQLTPEQAREGHRWIRLTVLAAVLQAWMMAAVVALLAPHLLTLSLALGAVYSLAAPLLYRYLDRDIERRVTANGAADGTVRFARTTGLPSSSGLGTPRS